jgi:excisionase family DNA binding protein
MKKSNENKELLSPLEVANKLGVSYRTVAWWIQEKKIPSYRFGRHIRIYSSELNSWMKNCRQ